MHYTHVPSFLGYEGVAAGAVAPGTVGAVVGPADPYHVEVARGENLAASEPRAAIAVASRRSFFQARAGGHTAAVVAAVLLAAEQRHRVASDARELVPARRHEVRRAGEVELPLNTAGHHSGGAEADPRDGAIDAHLAGLQRDVHHLDVAVECSWRAEAVVAGEGEEFVPRTGFAEAEWVGNADVAARCWTAQSLWWCWRRRLGRNRRRHLPEYQQGGRKKQQPQGLHLWQDHGWDLSIRQSMQNLLFNLRLSC